MGSKDLIFQENIGQTVEQMDTATHLEEGMYAVFKETPDQTNSRSYSELYGGDCLLIEELEFANGNLHSIRLKDHPRNADEKNNCLSFTFLFEEFYDYFNVISRKEGQSIRELEIAEINKQIEYKKEHYADLERNPSRLQQICIDIYSRRIESPSMKSAPPQFTTVNELLGAANPIEAISSYSASYNMARDLLTIKMDYLSELNKQIMELTKKITPYYMENALSAVAATKRQRDDFVQLSDSLASMQLYSGNGVEVVTISEGAHADKSVPLTLMQDQLWADVELAYYNVKAATKLTAEDTSIFFDELKVNQELVNQIFPTERCICIMATTKKSVKYNDGEQNIFFKMRLEELNKKAFMLVRNGENIHVVYSPIASHLAAKKLFPSKNEMDKFFFNAHNNIEINIDSLDYAKATSKADRETLHYKRFLILISGLQANHKLFGDFYDIELPFNFFNLSFQEKYFNYIYDQDGEGLLGDGNQKTLLDWIFEKNRALRKGSSIVTNNKALVIPELMAACFRYNYNVGTGSAQVKEPVEDLSIVKVEQNKEGIYFAKIECTNEAYIWGDKPPQVVKAVCLLPEGRSAMHYTDYHTIPFLVLDNISIEELEYYTSNRKYRADYISFLEVFNLAKKHLTSQSKSNEKVNYHLNVFKHLDQSELKKGQLKSMVQGALSFFGDAKSKQKIVSDYLSYQLIPESVEELKKTLNHCFASLPADGQPVFMTYDNKGDIFVYTKNIESEQLNQLKSHVWLDRHLVQRNKNETTLSLVDKNVSLEDYRRDECIITILDQECYNDYRVKTAFRQQSLNGAYMQYSKIGLFDTYGEKVEMLNALNSCISILKKIVTNTVDRKTAHLIANAVDDSYGLSLFVGFSSNRPIGVTVIGAEQWIKNLCDLYEDNRVVEVVEQNNSQICFAVESFNMPKVWYLENLLRLVYRTSNVLTESAKSLGYAFDVSSIEIGYSPLGESLEDIVENIDNVFGNVHVKKADGNFVCIKKQINTKLKNEHKYLEQSTFLVVVDKSKVHEWKTYFERIVRKVEENHDLQKMLVDTYELVSKEYVLFRQDIQKLANSFSRKSHEDIGELSWSNKYQAYMSLETLIALDLYESSLLLGQ